MQERVSSIRRSQIAKSVQTFTSQIAKSHRNDKTATHAITCHFSLFIAAASAPEKRGEMSQQHYYDSKFTPRY